jgi:hypothetical protein
MDSKAFDRLVADAARRPTRRTALRLLTAGLLAGLVPVRARAQGADRDNDGLLDDDEVNVYGTLPDNPDTDGDNVGDGQEICNRDGTDPANCSDPVHTNPLVNEDAAAPPPPVDNPAPPAAATCTAVGGPCSSTSTCCEPDPNYTYVQCCFDANGAGTCTDVVASGLLMCPDVVPASGCPAGQTICGGFCTDLLTDNGNCGACGNDCPFGYNCTSGICVLYCGAYPHANCNGVCVDLSSDHDNCGACGVNCGVHPDTGYLLDCTPFGCAVPF